MTPNKKPAKLAHRRVFGGKGLNYFSLISL
jgi:hypothetical protein